jgi:hypothetical protein
MEEIRFASNSPLEETGFEPSIPHDTIKGSEGAPHVIAGAGTLFSDQLNDQLFVG